MSNWNQSGSYGERELEWHPPPEFPEIPPLPPSRWERVKAFLRRMKEQGLAGLRFLVPSQAAVLMTLVWFGLAAFTIHMGGAYLSRHLENPFQVLLVMVGLTVGLPLMLRPRLDRSPMGLGIVLNFLALGVLVLLTRPTAAALGEHGDWSLRWIDAKQQPGPLWTGVRLGAKAVTSVTAWGIGMVPPDLIAEAFGPVPMTESTVPGASGTSRGKGENAEGKGANAGGAAAGSGDAPLPPVLPRVSTATAVVAARQGGEAAAGGGAVGGGAAESVGAAHSIGGEVANSSGSAMSYDEKLWSRLLNAERVRGGMEPLTLHESLSQVARAHAVHLERTGVLAHADGRGDDVATRVANAGLSGEVEEVLLQAPVSQGGPPELLKVLTGDVAGKGFLLNPGMGAMGVGMACGDRLCMASVLFLR